MDLLSDLTEKLGDCLTYLGLIFVLKNCLGCLVNIYAGWRSYVLPQIVGLFRSDDFVERFGEWAVVTGCTGGIGREYALGLAKKGMSMVLVSRIFHLMVLALSSISWMWLGLWSGSCKCLFLYLRTVVLDLLGAKKIG